MEGCRAASLGPPDVGPACICARNWNSDSHWVQNNYEGHVAQYRGPQHLSLTSLPDVESGRMGGVLL